MHGVEVSAENQLRQVKSDIALLNHYLSEAEKGHEMPCEELNERIERTQRILRSLSDGRVDYQLDSVSGGVGAPSLLQGTVPHTRVVGKQGVSNLQRRTAQQLLSELSLIESSLQRLNHKAEKHNMYLSEVDQLMGSLRNNGTHDDVSALQHAERERASLQYARARVQAMINESNSVMKALQDQGRSLESTNSRVADILESLGVSNSTTLQILRRNKVDAWLVYGGIALTLLFIYLIW
ncbi:SNARE protein, putative [Trypanosoma brucei brucei TREU927]|uniref:SNARE protein, putative n=1 Tax=Trypanosoma brucei brucei (strain 927/4 GUTat10.1) TaxID=185431 RepID=Q387W3_TRYB2|nr:SNARE protein, putative [Trypanosoma brucei brucei TREU927]EAN78909.1 SNARE protein, putative [Trypanosoma brucei brucei TREU927]